MSVLADFFTTDVTTVKDVPAEEFISAFAQHLKNQDKIEIPKWVEYVKTGVRQELAPYNRDWMYVRAAAVARQIYIRKDSGIGGLRKAYGGAGRTGTCKAHHTLAS